MLRGMIARRALPFVALPFVALPAMAQPWSPDRPIRFVVSWWPAIWTAC